MPIRSALEHVRHDLKRIRAKGSFTRNAFTAFGGYSVVLMSQLVFTPIIARVYGPEAYGIYGLFVALVTNLSSFTDLGYSMAYVLPREHDRFMHLFRLNFSLLILLCLLSFIPALLHTRLYALVPSWAPLGPYILLVPLGLFGYGMSTFFTQWLTRERAFKASTIIGTSASVSLRIFNLAYGLLRKGATHGLVLGEVVVNILATVVYWSTMTRFGIKGLFKDWSWRVVREVAVEFKRYPFFIFPEKWVTLVGMQLPVFLLIADPVVVGQFALTSSLLMIPLRLLGYSFSTVYIQKAAETVDSDPLLLGRITRGLYERLFWVGLAPFTAMIFFSDMVFSFVLGDSWHDAGVIAAYMSLFFFFRLMSEPMVTLFYAQRREHRMLIFQSLLTVARLAVMLPLVHWGFGSGTAILGFAVVSALAYLVLGYMLLHAAGEHAARLTMRSLLFTVLACGLFALARFAVVGSWWPAL